MTFSVRHAKGKNDWKFINEACCRTGDGGKEIAPERWPFFQKIWVSPYERFCSNEAYLLEKKEGDQFEKIGYLTGCFSTHSLKIKKQKHLDRDLFRALSGEIQKRNLSGDEKRFYNRHLKITIDPERSFGYLFLKKLYEDYPAHLHMNLLEGARGSGGGSKLFQLYRADLFASKIKGLHLFCGAGPLSFYQREGMKILKQIEFRPGVNVFAMGLKIK